MVSTGASHAWRMALLFVQCYSLTQTGHSLYEGLPGERNRLREEVEGSEQQNNAHDIVT